MSERSGDPSDWLARPQARSWTCPPAPDDARGFHAGLPGYASTPLVDAPGLAAALGVARVLVKDESQRWDLGAFKFLGASWAGFRAVAARTGYTGPPSLAGLREQLAGLPEADRPVLVTATDGNHGRAVARTARLLGLAARVLVPEVVPAHVVERISAEGPELERLPGGYDDAVDRARGMAGADPRLELVQDMGWPGYQEVPGWVVEGYSTLLHEVDDALAAQGLAGQHLVAVPVGVGSLLEAVLVHHRAAGRPGPAPAVLSVEPDTAACVLAGLRAGAPVTVPTGSTVMNGLNCGTPSGSAWPVIEAGLDAAVAVTDEQARTAVADLAAAGVASGPSGAASLAGARAALTGPGAPARRSELGLPPDPVVVLLNTEGFEPEAA
jgi:diaminopropionate ammonia-lyase